MGQNLWDTILGDWCTTHFCRLILVGIGMFTAILRRKHLLEICFRTCVSERERDCVCGSRSGCLYLVGPCCEHGHVASWHSFRLHEQEDHTFALCKRLQQLKISLQMTLTHLSPVCLAMSMLASFVVAVYVLLRTLLVRGCNKQHPYREAMGFQSASLICAHVLYTYTYIYIYIL